MESSDQPANTDALRDAELARDELASSIVLPRGHDLLVGAAVALYVVGFALGVTIDEGWTRLCLFGGVVLLVVVSVVEIRRFSRLNGVRLSGFAHQVVLGNAPIAVVTFMAALIGAYLAADRELWWLVGVSAVAGAVGYVYSGRRWLRAYRSTPSLGTRTLAARANLVMALAGALALAALLLLAVVG